MLKMRPHEPQRHQEAVRYRWNPRRRQPGSDDRRGRAAPGPGGRAALSPPGSPRAHRHRQGHAPLRLHARERAAGGHRVGGRRRDAGRAAADAGHRVHHLVDARRRRRGDQRVAQPVPGQRHQDLRRRRLQAARRDRGRSRAAHGGHRRGAGRGGHRARRHRQGDPHRRRARPLRAVPEERLPQGAHARRHQGGRRLRARRRLSLRAAGVRGAGRPRDRARHRPRRPQHQRRRGRAAPREHGRGGAEARARSWASRSTATPTA